MTTTRNNNNKDGTSAMTQATIAALPSPLTGQCSLLERQQTRAREFSASAK